MYRHEIESERMHSEPQTFARTSQRVLIILAKYPQPGQVKTRLGASIGAEAAAYLYHAFLADLAPRFARQTGRLPFDVCWVYTPDTPKFEHMIIDFGFMTNGGQVIFTGHATPDLSAHQVRQLQWAQSVGYQESVIITTDTPHLQRSTVEDAFHQLNENDVVIGPAQDGGYYLLGVKQSWQILEQVKMSTHHVAQEIMENARLAQLKVGMIEKMIDIDNKEDLYAFIHLMQPSGGIYCPKTWSKLKELGLV
jgi:rSAM/selenodomain-associated transferase 1